MQREDNADVSNEDQQDINNDSNSDEAPITVLWNMFRKRTMTTDESSSNGDESSKPGRVYSAIGVITIIFGIIVGIYLIVKSSQGVTIFGFESNGELTLVEVATALGVSMLFIVPGTICVGVAKIIELLDK